MITPDMVIVFGLLGVAILLFARTRLRFDLVGLSVLSALLISGILTPEEGLAGFSNPVVLTIAGLFVVGGALIETGVADRLGNAVARLAGTRESALVGTTMTISAALSGFMSSTGTTAVLLPVIVSVGRSAGVNPSKLLIPLSFASLLGGTLTLIGTAPNIVVNSLLIKNQATAFGFFSFLPMGLTILGIGLCFMIFVGRHMLPDSARSAAGKSRTAAYQSKSELAQAYELKGTSFRLRIRRSSPMLGLNLAEANLRQQYGVTLVEIQYRESDYEPLDPPRPVTPQTVLRPLSLLHVQGSGDAVRKLAHEQGFAILIDEDESHSASPASEELGLAEVLLPPRSKLVGQTLKETRFRERYGVDVLGLKRLGAPLNEDLREAKLQFGDALLIEGTWDRVKLLQDETQDFIVVGQPAELDLVNRPLDRAAVAAGILISMILLMTLNWLPVVTAVFLAAIAMVFSGCLTMEQAYRRMSWESVVLIAAMLPMATAMEKTGGVDFVAHAMVNYLGCLGPHVLLAGVFLLTSAFSHFISNTATAVLLAPIAFQAATTLDLAPQPFMMAVAIAASTSLGTPVASPSNTLVFGPGGYRFQDYLRVGLSLQFLILITCLIMLPILFPF